MKQPNSKLRKQIAKLFTDSHTPWPEMKPIEWPDTFADKALSIFHKEQDALLAELEKEVKARRWTSPKAIKGSIMWSQEMGHEKALDSVTKVIQQIRKGLK